MNRVIYHLELQILNIRNPRQYHGMESKVLFILPEKVFFPKHPKKIKRHKDGEFVKKVAFAKLGFKQGQKQLNF